MGLNEKEAELYILLVRSGPKMAKDLNNIMKCNRVHLYRMLKDLQMKGLVESTLDFPAEFNAVKPRIAIDLFLSSKKKELNLIQKNKAQIIASLEEIQAEEPLTTIGKFAVIEGMDSLVSKSLQMSKETKKELLLAHDKLAWMIEDFAGDFGVHLRNAKKARAYVRLLTTSAKDNLQMVNQIRAKNKSLENSFVVRVLDLEPSLFQDYLIRDEEEILFSLTPYEDLKVTKSSEYKGLWTNNRQFVRSMKMLFEKNWKEAHEIKSLSEKGIVSS